MKCIVPGCTDSAVPFPHFPTVVGYCPTHGGVLADFLSLVDSAGPVGLDGSRQRWENERTT